MTLGLLRFMLSSMVYYLVKPWDEIELFVVPTTWMWSKQWTREAIPMEFQLQLLMIATICCLNS
jgi:hypothetical protein